MKKLASNFFKSFMGMLVALMISVVISNYAECSVMPVFLGLTIVAMVIQSYKSVYGINMPGMAYDLVISDTTYAGEFASYFWIPATFGMDTIQKGAVYVQDGIKKQHTIGRMDFSNPLQTRVPTPTPTPTSSFTVDGRVLVPQDMMLYTEFNPRDYEQHWLAVQLSNTLLARELPVTAENYMMQIALARAFESIELGIWQGSTSYQGVYGFGTTKYQVSFFDGYIKLFLNDASVVAIGSPVTLTNSNIGDKMQLMINGTKKALLASPKRYQRLKFFMSIASEQLYQQFLTNTTYKNNDTTEKGINRYMGYDVVPVAGMPDNTIVFCEGLMDVSSNLYVGMNSTEDNNLQLQRLQNNSELFFLKGLMKYAVQYGFSDQVVLYTTLTTADFL